MKKMGRISEYSYIDNRIPIRVRANNRIEAEHPNLPKAEFLDAYFTKVDETLNGYEEKLKTAMRNPEERYKQGNGAYVRPFQRVKYAELEKEEKAFLQLAELKELSKSDVATYHEKIAGIIEKFKPLIKKRKQKSGTREPKRRKNEELIFETLNQNH